MGKFQKTVSGLIQWTLHAVGVWCNEVGLSVNLEKIGIVVFTRRRKQPGLFETRLFWTTLLSSMAVMYQGVILYFQLTWREHVDVKFKKAEYLF